MSHLWLPVEFPGVPEITDERLQLLSSKIKPLIRGRDDKLHYAAEEDLRTKSFTWGNPTGTPLADLTDVFRMETVHDCGYWGLFKPSVAEVLAQLQEQNIPYVNCFETLTDNTIAIFKDGMGHRSVTVFYLNPARPVLASTKL